MTKRFNNSASPATKPAIIAPAPVRAPQEIAKPGLAFAPDLSLAVSYVSPTELTEYGNNPRTHTPDQIEKIAESIKAFGFVSPLTTCRRRLDAPIRARKHLLLERRIKQILTNESS
jgi:hypothetical protein